MTSGQFVGQKQRVEQRDDDLAAAVRTEREFVRRRNAHFGATAFVDPSWAIMLQLFADDLEDHETGLDPLIVASGAGTKAAVRWIDALVQAGLVLTATSANATSVRLTADGKARMAGVFGASL